MSSRWDAIKKNLKDPNAVKPWDIINPNTEWADEELKKQRFDICSSCPELISVTSQCKQCGCVMKVKTGLKLATCPLGKW